MTAPVEEAQEAPEAAQEAVVALGTYFVLGVGLDGAPALYLAAEAPAFSRERVANLNEARHVVDMVASELHLRAVAATVAQEIEERTAARQAMVPPEDPQEG